MGREPHLPKQVISIAAMALISCMLLATSAWGQQTYITRYDLFAGYSHFNSSNINLSENGLHMQIGLRPSRWYSIGFDYSNVKGDLSLAPERLTPDLQNQLKLQLGQLAALGLLPAGYTLSVPSSSWTQTFTVGPQLAFRKWVPVTLFVRPSIGLIREVATPHPKDAIATRIVAQLAPSGKKKDWAWFFGGGGGIDFNFNPHFAIRMQADYVYDHLFADILKDGRPTVRVSVGPAFNFGRNIAK